MSFGELRAKRVAVSGNDLRLGLHPQQSDPWPVLSGSKALLAHIRLKVFEGSMSSCVAMSIGAAPECAA